MLASYHMRSYLMPVGVDYQLPWWQVQSHQNTATVTTYSESTSPMAPQNCRQDPAWPVLLLLWLLCWTSMVEVSLQSLPLGCWSLSETRGCCVPASSAFPWGFPLISASYCVTPCRISWAATLYHHWRQSDASPGLEVHPKLLTSVLPYQASLKRQSLFCRCSFCVYKKLSLKVPLHSLHTLSALASLITFKGLFPSKISLLNMRIPRCLRVSISFSCSSLLRAEIRIMSGSCWCTADLRWRQILPEKTFLQKMHG